MNIKADGAKIIFHYSVFNSTLGNETAIAEISMVLLDREKERPVKPESFIRMLKNDNNKGKHEQ